MTKIAIFPGAVEQFLRIMGARTETFPTIARWAAEYFGPAAPTAAEIAVFICRDRRGRSFLKRLHRDPEVADWLLANAPGRTIAELRSAAIATFGAARTPARSSIHRFLVKRGGRGLTRHKSRADRDPEVASWLLEYRVGHNLDSLRAACMMRFGAGRTPSRSALHRFLHR